MKNYRCQVRKDGGGTALPVREQPEVINFSYRQRGARTVPEWDVPEGLVVYVSGVPLA